MSSAVEFIKNGQVGTFFELILIGFFKKNRFLIVPDPFP